MLVDPGLKIVSANEAYAHLVVSSVEELPGRTLWEVAPLTTGVVSGAVAAALETGEPVVGTYVPYNFAELVLDVLPVRPRGPDPRALVVMSDRRRIKIAAPEGASGARRGFFDVARRMAWAATKESTEAVVNTLAFATATYGLSRAYVRLAAPDEASYPVAYQHHRPELPALDPSGTPAASLSWALGKLGRGEAIALSGIEELPADAAGFASELLGAGAGAVVCVPVQDGPEVIGLVVYAAERGRGWSRAETDLLRMLGEMIAGVVVRVRAERELLDRHSFEEVLSSEAARFVGLDPAEIDLQIEHLLSAVGENRALDRAMIMRLDPTGSVLRVTHEWLAAGVPSVKSFFARDFKDLSPITKRVLTGETFVGRCEDSPPGTEMRVLLDRMGVHAAVLAPLRIEGKITGVLNAQALRHRRGELGAARARVNLIADVIASALSHQAAALRIRRWEKRFARVLETAMDGVATLDASGVVQDWTEQAESVLGKSKEDALGASFASFVAEEDQPLWRERLASALTEGACPQRFELRGVRGDGTPLPIELSMTCLERTVGPLVAVFIRDITERKQIEAERQRAFEEVSRQKRSLERERDYLREEQTHSPILGESAAIRASVELLEAVTDTSSTVLLLGESGVGKEVFAAALHARSRRSAGPFVRVNCASIPASLFESEFFGHVKGAFTGAIKDRVGRFELANGGTLFLDEVGEIPLDLQAKLLRVLQEGTFERIGDDRTRKVDARVVAATNRDLQREVEAGRFRRDLYFRLGVFPIVIPPLRDRGDDVLLLARRFLERHASRGSRGGGAAAALGEQDEARLLAYDWPGNVRELEHVLERAVILARGGPLRLDLALPLPQSTGPKEAEKEDVLREEDMRKLERDNLVLALKKAKGRVSGAGGAAELLGIRPSTLRDRMKAHGIARDD